MMISSQGISKNPSKDPSLDFAKLREEGIAIIQALSGKVWTDYNLHDPGVTTLEILCYALTEVGYRTELLKEAFEADEPAEADFIERYFFRYEELIPPLPVTKWDFEHFIEKKHKQVLSAWFEEYPILHPRGPICGGYEIALLLEADKQFGDLNTDAILFFPHKSDTTLEIILFDAENRRIKLGNIRKVTSCEWNEEDPDSFFVFENNNCQVTLTLEVVYQNKRKSTRLPVKARVTVNPDQNSKRKASHVTPQQEDIVQHLESQGFLETLEQALAREQHKAKILTDIRQTLLPYRNLCEDFVALRGLNQQEIKIGAEIVLDDQASGASTMINRVYDCLDAFLLHLFREAKAPENRGRKNILYASNLINEMVKIESVAGARVDNLNLFVDGVPTIPLQDETSFECIHLQRFSHYVPKISREKSDITFIRSGVREEAEPSSISKAFNLQPQFFGKEKTSEGRKTEKPEPGRLHQSFFENLRRYYSIQHDFPQNYRLREGQFSEKAPENLKVSIKQFKAFLLFFERLLIDYLEKLYHFNDLLSVKQSPKISVNEAERLKEALPDLERLELLDDTVWEHKPAQSQYGQLQQRHKILDHLLARFATSYTSILPEEGGIQALEKTLRDKMMLLKDIPRVTRDRGLGLPMQTEEKSVWGSDLLSGFQKSIYRLLGVHNENLRHLQLTRAGGQAPVGFYLVEHILLVPREEDSIFSKKFNHAAELLFEYLSQLSDDYQKHDPYSLQLTILVPAWYTSWSKRSKVVENALRKALPAHIYPYIHWLDKKNMKEFEILYEDWLEALLRLYE